MWSGVEPREGYYDMEYLAKLGSIVDNFRDNGIYVILDMHQDVASRHFKTYDGFPGNYLRRSSFRCLSTTISRLVGDQAAGGGGAGVPVAAGGDRQLVLRLPHLRGGPRVPGQHQVT